MADQRTHVAVAAGVPAPRGMPPPPTPAHGHIWRLPDGTGLHAPPGGLTRDAVGRVCCHLCGRWFRALGQHVRAHGHTAASYRSAMGLCTTKPLTSQEFSATISNRQASAYRSSPDMRDRLGPGQAMARTGQLAWRARAARSVTDVPAERATLHRAALAAGRNTRALRRTEQVAGRLQALGATTLDEYLRRAYTAGASLDRLSRDTGLGRVRLRREMADAGIPPRRPGHQSAEAKRARARTAEAAAAVRVGTEDLHRWLADRRSGGWTLTRLADAVGHSAQWVRWRLDQGGPLTDLPTTRDRLERPAAP
jgi:hypothetical protein